MVNIEKAVLDSVAKSVLGIVKSLADKSHIEILGHTLEMKLIPNK